MRKYWSGLLALCVMLAIVVASLPPSAAAQDATSPLETAQEFYSWYLAYSAPDASGNFKNPLAERAYRDSTLLTARWIGAVDALLADEFHADPFVCAQALPERFDAQLINEDGNWAYVLLRERFGLTAHNITVALVNNGAGWQIDAVICGEMVTPAGVAESFYRWYIGYSQYDEAAETRHNPLVDGAYREHPLLAPELVAELDTVVQSGALLADPLLCAQDIPGNAYAFTVREGDASAVVVLREYFGVGAESRDVEVSLSYNGEVWQIDAVRCAVTPEAVIELVYSHYAQQVREVIAQDMQIDLIQNPMRPWNLFLSPALLDDLAAGQPTGRVDPLLCAQDIPDGFEVAADGAGYLVSGLYPSGPGESTAYPLVRVLGAEKLTGWEITDIACYTP